MFLPILLTGLLELAPKPNEQFQSIPAKTCHARLMDVKSACEMSQAVEKCHENIDLFYLFCGGSND